MSDHPFDRVRPDQQELRAYDEARYEESRVLYLAGVFGFGAARVRELRSVDADGGGRGRLTFAAFNDAYRSFPLLLAASTLDGVQLHLDARSLLPALFNDFASAPFVKKFEEFYEQNADRAEGRALGLVFRRKGLRQGLVLHSGGIEALPYRGFEGVYAGGSAGETPRRLYLRPYQGVLEAVHRRGHGWRP